MPWERFQHYRGGVTKPFFTFRYFPIFHNDQNTGYLYDIAFKFDRRPRSWVAETPDKYESDWKYLNYTFAVSKSPLTDKLTNRALVTPTTGLWAGNIHRSSVVSLHKESVIQIFHIFVARLKELLNK